MNLENMLVVDLAGDWRYLPIGATSDEEASQLSQPDYSDLSWLTMRLPQNWYPAGLDHHGVVWFRRSFTYQPSLEGFPQEGIYHTLRFEGVDYFADVYLNGVHLGRHEGYFEPFVFDVTGILRPGENLLAVRVDSPYETPGLDGWHMRKKLIKGVLNHHDCRPGGGWEAQGQSYNTGGIWNRVLLLEHGALTIERALLRADLEANPPILHVDLRIKNRAAPMASQLTIHCIPCPAASENLSAGKDSSPQDYQAGYVLSIPAGESRRVFSLPVPGVQLWQPWDRGQPSLYEVTLQIGAAEVATAGMPQVRYTNKFGFRAIRVDEDYHWFVNGERYFPRGSNYIASQWLAELLDAPGSALYPVNSPQSSDARQRWFNRDVGLMKGANLNFIRIHAHVLPEEFYTVCDREGILVWQDFPLQWGYSDEPAFHREAERQMVAMVELLHNHPSIAVWCCHNESPWYAEWMAATVGIPFDPTHNRDLDIRLEKTARSLDNTRYIHRNTGTGDGHTYPGWYFGSWQDFRNLPAAPLPTEYGAQALPVKESLLRMFGEYGSQAGHAELVRMRAFLDQSQQYQDYRRLPPVEQVPEDLYLAREVWTAYRFHNFQPPETFHRARVTLGASLDEFIASSQAYQSQLIQFATETYRRHKYRRVTGIFQFMFTDPWPAITWSVLDYWRTPKSGYEALSRAMQPVLPSARLPMRIRPGKSTRINFCVVNDLAAAFPQAIFRWTLLDAEEEQLAGNEFRLDIPADGVSRTRRVNINSLPGGKYRLETNLLASNESLLGVNWYEFEVH